jgi:hypothetical protein
MEPESEVERKQFEVLKQQIDTSASQVDYSQGFILFGRPPTESTYRAACRYAHVRYIKCCECTNWLYDHIRKMRRQVVINQVKAEGRPLRMSDLKNTKEARASGLPLLRVGDESWINAARKGELQQEINKAVIGRRMMEAERDRLMPLAQEAAKAEHESRPYYAERL